jgi:hypothetical protein
LLCQACKRRSMPTGVCGQRGAWLLLVVAFAAYQLQQCHGQVTGEAVYNVSGTYTFAPPSGVTSVSVVCVGAGGGSGTYLGWPTAVLASGGWRMPPASRGGTGGRTTTSRVILNPQLRLHCMAYTAALQLSGCPQRLQYTPAAAPHAAVLAGCAVLPASDA